jgi:hypothetical protein
MKKICLIINESDVKFDFDNLIQNYIDNINYELFSKIFIIHKNDNIIKNNKDIIKYINTLENNVYEECELENFDYAIYINNKIIFDINKLSIDFFINILETNDNLNQIIFDNPKLYNDLIEIELNNLIVYKKNISKRAYEYDYFRFENIKDILLDNKNPYPKPNDIENTNFNNYTSPRNYNLNYFELTNSIIKLDSFKTFKKFPINEFTFFEKNISRELFNNNLYSVIFDNNIFINNYLKKNIIKQYDFLNMTIVTGYFKLGISSQKKSGYSYLDCSPATLSIPQKMVIYISEQPEIFEQVINIRKDLMSITKIIIIDETKLYMFEHADKIKVNCTKNSKTYQNNYYIMSVGARYNYLKNAIENNYFNTEYFSWIDFSLNHGIIMDNFKPSYDNKDKIKIAWIARFNSTSNILKYNTNCLGGGVYCGHKNTMLKLIELHDAEFINLMNLGYNINDDKLLFLIFEKYPELFDTYYCAYKYLCYKFYL